MNETVTVKTELTAEMIAAAGHINSEWLNDNAPIGEKRYALPILAIWLKLLEMAEKK